jgi:hypothetical protein
MVSGKTAMISLGATGWRICKMYHDNDEYERILCLECWKGHMVKVELHVHLVKPNGERTEPLIINRYFCDECERIANEP